MMKPGPNETVITGGWITIDGKIEIDPPTARIRELVESHLQRFAVDRSGWDTLYLDPDDGRLWEHTYPKTEMQGGGPPQLRVIAAADAIAKYGAGAVEAAQEYSAAPPMDEDEDEDEEAWQDAHARAKRRKSPWNLLLIPACAIPLGLLTWRGALLFGALHQAIYPGQTFTLASKGLGVVLVAVAPFFGSIPLALYFGNVLVWLVPPARRAFDREAEEFPGTEFHEVQRDLLSVARYVVPPALLAALIGALLPWH